MYVRSRSKLSFNNIFAKICVRAFLVMYTFLVCIYVCVCVVLKVKQSIGGTKQ